MALSLSSVLGSTWVSPTRLKLAVALRRLRWCFLYVCGFVDLCILYLLLHDVGARHVFLWLSCCEWSCPHHLPSDCELCVECHQRHCFLSEVDNATDVLLLYSFGQSLLRAGRGQPVGSLAKIATSWPWFMCSTSFYRHTSLFLRKTSESSVPRQGRPGLLWLAVLSVVDIQRQGARDLGGLIIIIIVARAKATLLTNRVERVPGYHASVARRHRARGRLRRRRHRHRCTPGCRAQAACHVSTGTHEG